MLENAARIYYRGANKSCNYSCSYCPFAKHRASTEEIHLDQRALEQFCDAIERITFKGSVDLLFIPYGESLIYDHTIRAMARLSKKTAIRHIGCQTNLSWDVPHFFKLLQEGQAVLEKIKLWCSYHPEMTTQSAFLGKMDQLYGRIAFSVGAVGDPANIGAVTALRKALPRGVYLWINKMDGLKRRYTIEEINQWQMIDPLFELELHESSSNLGCLAGKENFGIEATGDIFACIRSKYKLGNLFQPEHHLPQKVGDDPARNMDGFPVANLCKRKSCDCYLAYSNLSQLKSLRLFGKQVPFRIMDRIATEALFFDVDGTLLTSEKGIDKTVEETLAYLARSKKLYLATSLPYKIAMKKCRSIRHLLSGGIFSGGAQIFDFETCYEKTFFLEAQAAEFLKQQPQAYYYEINERIYKMTFRMGEHKQKAFIEKLDPLYKETLNISNEKNVLSITDKSITKLSGILLLCRHKGIQENRVIVVGNGINDIPMLQHFEYSIATPRAAGEIRNWAKFTLMIEHLPLIIA